jgi:hypothetical protein
MKLSEAIRMNGMMREQGFGGDSISSLQAPCALGGALQSVGKQQARSDDNYPMVARTWPWSRNDKAQVFTCPACPKQTLAANLVWHLNDNHFWTRSRIADWVASVEPQEEQEDGGQGPVQATLEVAAS